MEIIKSIRKLKNNQYTLTTESGKKISVSEDTLVRHRLLKGEEITDESLEKIKKEGYNILTIEDNPIFLNWAIMLYHLFL